MKARPRPKLGILALTLDFYEQFAPALRGARERWVRSALLPRLEEFAEVRFEGAVCRREEVARVVEAHEAGGADALLVLLLTYSPSQVALPALQRTRLPIVIWNTQELARVDASFTIDQMIDNHGVHGTQDLANVLLRAGVKFEYLTSECDSAPGLEQVRDFAIAAASAQRLRSARVGLLGHPFPGMGDFSVDSSHLLASLGCSWVHLSMEDYIKRAASAAAPEVAGLVEEYLQRYAVSSAVTRQDLEATARAEIALRGLVTDQRLDAFTYQFLAFGEDERVSTVPFVAASRLMAEGIGFGGEGDLVSAAGTALFHWLSPAATFSEVFTIDFEGNRLFMSHMGEANAGMARRDRKIPFVVRPTPITRTRDRQCALALSLEPGPATVCALTQGPGGRWRIIASPVTVTETPELAGFYVPYFLVRPRNDVREFLTAYAKAGGPHHNAICVGDARPRLRLAAGMLDADYLEI